MKIIENGEAKEEISVWHNSVKTAQLTTERLAYQPAASGGDRRLEKRRVKRNACEDNLQAYQCDNREQKCHRNAAHERKHQAHGEAQQPTAAGASENGAKAKAWRAKYAGAQKAAQKLSAMCYLSDMFSMSWLKRKPVSAIMQ